MARCCCGQFDLDPVYGPEITHNDRTHQILGPKDNFCGPAYLHLEHRLRTRVAELEAERGQLKELLYAKLEDIKDDGKTILDFYACWHRQDMNAIAKIKAERDALKAELDAIRQAQRDSYKHSNDLK